MNNGYLWSAIAVMALVTAAIRIFPFLIFGRGRKTPKIIDKLSRMLPTAIMGMLVIYCIKDISFATVDGFLPALISILIVVMLHLWQRNTLLSIIGGTVSYMLLVQLIF